MVGDRLVDGRLVLGVEGGVDLQAAGVPQLLPVGHRGAEGRVVQNLLGDVVAEEALPLLRGDAAGLRVGHLQVERARLGDLRLSRGDGAVRGHRGQHLVAADDGVRRVLDRVVRRGGLLQTGQHGGLGDAQLARGDAEVQLGSGLDTVRLLTEVGDVEVVVQDLLLGQRLLQLDRVPQFLDLAAHGLPGGLREARRVGVARVVDEDVLDVLLRQRGSALGDVPRAGVLQQRPQRALQVDRAVLVEAVVLDVDQGVLHDRRDLAERLGDAVLRVEPRDHVPGVVVDGGLLRQRRQGEVVRDRVEVGGGRLGAQADGADRGQAQGRHECAGQHAPAQQTH